MNPQKPAWDIYRRLLTPYGHGHPLWNPQNDSVKGGIHVGDVGYMKEWRFCHLFHATKTPQRTQPLDDKTPEGFAFIEDEYANGPKSTKFVIANPSDDIHATHLLSHSLVREDISLSAGIGTQDANLAGRLKLKCIEDSGAILVLSPPALTEDIQSIGFVKRYIRRHFRNWVSFANEDHGFDVEDEDIVFVVGTKKTSTWAMVAFTSTVRADGGTLDFSISKYGHADCKLDMERTFIPAASYARAPARPGLAPASALRPASNPRPASTPPVSNPSPTSDVPPASDPPQSSQASQREETQEQEAVTRRDADEQTSSNPETTDLITETIADRADVFRVHENRGWDRGFLRGEAEVLQDKAQGHPRDQTIFIHYFKAKRRFPRFIKLPLHMEAAAGPHNLSRRPDDKDDEFPGAGVLSVNSSVRVTSRNECLNDAMSSTSTHNQSLCADPVNTILYYILKVSSADMAIASTMDVHELLKGQPVPEDFEMFLSQAQPTVALDEDGVGTLALNCAGVGVEHGSVDALKVHANMERTNTGSDLKRSRKGGPSHQTSVSDGRVTSGSCKQVGSVEVPSAYQPTCGIIGVPAHPHRNSRIEGPGMHHEGDGHPSTSPLIVKVF
ncbi:hypothetical protein C8Q78DRAFT_1024066 [Trametes maxima]|nr:hypothetical protein C8Q78DRAFT_1024066 [Trametes maxima]